MPLQSHKLQGRLIQKICVGVEVKTPSDGGGRDCSRAHVRMVVVVVVVWMMDLSKEIAESDVQSTHLGVPHHLWSLPGLLLECDSALIELLQDKRDLSLVLLCVGSTLSGHPRSNVHHVATAVVLKHRVGHRGHDSRSNVVDDTEAGRGRHKTVALVGRLKREGELENTPVVRASVSVGPHNRKRRPLIVHVGHLRATLGVDPLFELRERVSRAHCSAALSLGLNDRANPLGNVETTADGDRVATRVRHGEVIPCETGQ